MKKVILAVSFFFFSISVFAQTYSKGYIIKSSGDTLRGFIYDNNEWFDKDITFKEGDSKAPVVYPLNELKEIFIAAYDDHYFVKTITVDMKPIRTSTLETTSKRKMVTKPIMLKLLVRGRITLYIAQDKSKFGKNHFFVQKDTTTQELEFVRYLKKEKIIELKMYVGLLKNLASDCNAIHISDRIFSEESLKAFVTDYNSCFGEKSYVKKSEKVQLHGGFKAGVSYTTLNYYGDDETSYSNPPYPSATRTKFNYAPAFEGGVWLDIGSTRISNPFYVTLGLNYKSIGTMSGVLSGTDYTRKYNAKYSFTTFSAGAKYFFHNQTPRFYLLGAGNVNYLNTYSNEAVINDGGTGYVTVKETFNRYKSSGIGYKLGVGWSHNRLSTELFFQDDVFSGVLIARAHLISIGGNVGWKLF